MKNKFFLVCEGDNRVLVAKKIIPLSRYGLWDFIFLFLGELSTCLQNLIHIRCGTLKLNLLSIRVSAEIPIQRLFFDNHKRRI
jgi:hypothetical protein